MTRSVDDPRRTVPPPAFAPEPCGDGWRLYLPTKRRWPVAELGTAAAVSTPLLLPWLWGTVWICGVPMLSAVLLFGTWAVERWSARRRRPILELYPHGLVVDGRRYAPHEVPLPTAPTPADDRAGVTLSLGEHSWALRLDDPRDRDWLLAALRHIRQPPTLDAQRARHQAESALAPMTTAATEEGRDR